MHIALMTALLRTSASIGEKSLTQPLGSEGVLLSWQQLALMPRWMSEIAVYPFSNPP